MANGEGGAIWQRRQGRKKGIGVELFEPEVAGRGAVVVMTPINALKYHK